MALHKPRFVHYQAFSRHTPYRGFTVLLNPGNAFLDGFDAEKEVYVSVALCHKVDHFCRATGRDYAYAKEPTVLKVVELPMFLAELEAKCRGYKINPENARFEANHWAWIWKYFL